jgi:hypothetical protein
MVIEYNKGIGYRGSSYGIIVLTYLWLQRLDLYRLSASTLKKFPRFYPPPRQVAFVGEPKPTRARKIICEKHNNKDIVVNERTSL